METDSLLSLLVLSTGAPLCWSNTLLAVVSSTSPSSSPSSESKEFRSATTMPSEAPALHADGAIKRSIALWSLALRDSVWFDIVSSGRYWLYRFR